jgi:predicted DNA-binding transcriptional regulator AlpA
MNSFDASTHPAIGKPQVARLCGVTVTCPDRWLREKRFPQPDFLLPTGRKRWHAATIEAWLASRSAAKGGVA